LCPNPKTTFILRRREYVSTKSCVASFDIEEKEVKVFEHLLIIFALPWMTSHLANGPACPKAPPRTLAPAQP